MAKKNDTKIVYGDGFADITLDRQLDIDGAKTSTLRMREPTVADVELVDGMRDSEMVKNRKAIANLCDIAPDALKAMNLRDYARLNEAYAGFIA